MQDGNDFGIEEITDGVRIRVYVAPRASVNKIIGAHNGVLKIALTAPPVEGAANKALVDFLAKALGLPKSKVVLVSGETSRNKVVQARGISVDLAVAKLTARP